MLTFAVVTFMKLRKLVKQMLQTKMLQTSDPQVFQVKTTLK